MCIIIATTTIYDDDNNNNNNNNNKNCPDFLECNDIMLCDAIFRIIS